MENRFFNHFVRELSSFSPGTLEAAREVIDSICENIATHYEFIETVNSKRQTRSQDQGILISQFHKKKQAGDRGSSCLKNMISEDGFVAKVVLQNEWVAEGALVNHLRVHKQFVGNLCGYHASYNLIQALHSIKYQLDGGVGCL